MPPTLQVEQYQFTDTGTVLNSDASLPFVDINKVSGLDSATLRTTTKDTEGIDGGVVESLFEQMRTVVLEGTVYADPTQIDQYLDTLLANFAPTDNPQPFYWGTTAGMRVVYGKSQGLKYEKSNTRNYGKQDVNVTILCGDSRKYGTNTVSSGQIVLGSTSVSGRGYPKGFPFGYGGTAIQSAGSITHGGNRKTGGLYVIQGPITNPVVVNDTLGQQWTFAIDLPTGSDYLYISPKNKTVRLNSATGPSRRNKMRGPWWLLNPTQNNFRLLGTGSGNLTITAQPAWR